MRGADSVGRRQAGRRRPRSGIRLSLFGLQPVGLGRHVEVRVELAARRHAAVPRDAAAGCACAERRRAAEPGRDRPRQRDTGSLLGRERRRHHAAAAGAVHRDGHVGGAGRHGRGHRGGSGQHFRGYRSRESADDRAGGHLHDRLRLDARPRRAPEPGVLGRLLRHRHQEPDRGVHAAGDPRCLLSAGACERMHQDHPRRRHAHVAGRGRRALDEKQGLSASGGCRARLLVRVRRGPRRSQLSRARSTSI